MSGWLGNVPSWLTVVVAAAALMFTARTSRASRKSAAAAQEQINHRNRKEWEEQASKVAGWISVNIDAGTGMSVVYLHYVNANDVPAYNFVATLESCHTRRLKMRVLAPTDGVQTVQFPAATKWLEQEVGAKMSTYRPLPVGSTYSETAQIASDAQAHHVQQTGLSVQFQDSYGVIWRRGANGFLKEARIDDDRGWKGTVTREQAMKDSSTSEEEDEITIDIMATGAEAPQRTEMLPNVKKLSEGCDCKVDFPAG